MYGILFHIAGNIIWYQKMNVNNFFLSIAMCTSRLHIGEKFIMCWLEIKKSRDMTIIELRVWSSHESSRQRWLWWSLTTRKKCASKQLLITYASGWPLFSQSMTINVCLQQTSNNREMMCFFVFKYLVKKTSSSNILRKKLCSALSRLNNNTRFYSTTVLCSSKNFPSFLIHYVFSERRKGKNFISYLS